MEEEWKDIPDYTGYYQASNLGRIRSVDREVVYSDGRVRLRKGKMLKPDMTRGGYLRVGLSKDGKLKMFLIHRLVWMVFNGTIPEGYEVNHIDEDKNNNRLDNLNLMTHTQNINWGTRTARCSKPVIALDTDGNVVLEFSSAADAQRQGFHQGNLSACCRGKLKHHRGLRWKYINS